MDIFRLTCDYRGLKSIDYTNSPIQENLYNFKWNDIDEVSSFLYKWNIKNGSGFSNCPFIIGSIPVFSESVFYSLFNAFDLGKTQNIPINVEGNRFFILNTLNVVQDLLDKKKSDISFFPDGRIMKIDSFTFNKRKNLPPIFKIPETNINTFVNEEMASRIINIMPKELIMEKCKVSSKLWLF
jgi:hypothetical protein